MTTSNHVGIAVRAGACAAGLLLSSVVVAACGSRVPGGDSSGAGGSNTGGGGAGGDTSAVGGAGGSGAVLDASADGAVLDASADGAVLDASADGFSDGSTRDAADGGAGGACSADSGTFVAANAPSCAGNLTCNGESCCTTLRVPGGTFVPGYGNVTATVSAFALDKYEVTVGRFRNFVAAYEAGWRPAVGSGKNCNVTEADTSWQADWDDSTGPGGNMPMPGAITSTYFLLSCDYQSWTTVPGANENKPIVCLDWYEAFAFCIWDGGRLPTKHEWGYAAVGGSENREYPWGAATPTDCTFANGTITNDVPCGPGGKAELAAVGSYPAGNDRWGHADMSGNASEWTFDWWDVESKPPYVNHALAVSGSCCRNRMSSGFNASVVSALAAEPVGPRFSVGGVRCARNVQ